MKNKVNHTDNVKGQTESMSFRHKSKQLFGSPYSEQQKC
jgi:hypothetical protein